MDPVHTVNNEPDTTSVTSNNGPFDPLTANTVEPDLYMSTLPVANNEPDILTVWLSWLTNDAVVAFCAHDAVPNNEPVIPFCTVKLPVMIAEPLKVMMRFDDTSNIGDEPVYIVHNEPDTESVISNNGPCDPLTTSGDEPDLYMFTLPVAFNEPDMFTVWFN